MEFVRARQYTGETYLNDSPTLFSPVLIPLDANTPVNVLRPYTGPTYMYITHSMVLNKWLYHVVPH